MEFCVMIKISKRSVSFWYQFDGNAYAPLRIKESNEIPLYFYVNGNDFIFGTAARDRFNRHDPHAYGNYFQIIKDPGKHFSIYGNKKPVKQLFYYGVEQYLSYFLNTILYKTDSIESYRQHFPLRFLFDSDIEDNEKSLIECLFREAGYFDLDRVYYDKILFNVLAAKRTLPEDKAILLLSGIDDVLYFKLYKNIEAEVIGSLKLDGQGADPRVKILADMIIEYVILQNSYLSINTDAEVAALLPFCTGLLGNVAPIIMGDAELTDGNKYWFKVSERNLADRLQYYSNDNMIYSAIDDLLKSSGIMLEDVVILLGTEQISTSYFTSKLLKKYHYVKEVNAADTSEVMKSIFAEIARSSYNNRLKQQVNIPVLPGTPVFVRPSLPKLKQPPPLPPQKTSESVKPGMKIPKLPEVKGVLPKEINAIKRPPIPPKKTM